MLSTLKRWLGIAPAAAPSATLREVIETAVLEIAEGHRALARESESPTFRDKHHSIADAIVAHAPEIIERVLVHVGGPTS